LFDIIGAIRAFSIVVNQTVNVTWLFNGGLVQTDNSVTTASYTNSSAAQGTWDITAIANNENGSATQIWNWIVTPPGSPSITEFHPSSEVNDIIGALRTFGITVNQTVNVEWLINGVLAQTDTGVTAASYTNSSAAQGTWNITVIVKNDNGSATQKWDWIVTIPGPPSITFSAPLTPVSCRYASNLQHYCKSDCERGMAG
jgi:hypothetical protein